MLKKSLLIATAFLILPQVTHAGKIEECVIKCREALTTATDTAVQTLKGLRNPYHSERGGMSNPHVVMPVLHYDFSMKTGTGMHKATCESYCQSVNVEPAHTR